MKDFLDNIKEGYRKQDEAIAKEKKTSEGGERAGEGLLTGMVEGVLNPVRWLASIFR